jgi:hypothetical protein
VGLKGVQNGGVQEFRRIMNPGRTELLDSSWSKKEKIYYECLVTLV